jgi:hypothetical protein
MLTPVTCPHCQGSASLLEVISSVCLTDIYQCQACGQVSERPKGVSEGPLPIQTGAGPEPSYLKVPSSAVREGAVIPMSAWRRNV